MQWLRNLTMFLCLLLGASAVNAAPPVVLTYHDITPLGNRSLAKGYSVSADDLKMQLQWLELSGWAIISLADLQKNKQGLKDLPEKSVLFTFDDAEKSTCSTVYPIFAEKKIPFTIAIVSSWLKDTNDQEHCTWTELKEIGKNPLVSFATHTHDLHKDVLVNKWGGTQPAAVSKIWSNSTGLESNTDYYNRIKNDLSLAKKLIIEKTGVTPQAVVWPYGWYNRTTLEAAQAAGFNTTFSLNNGTTDLLSYRRKLMVAGMSLGQFKQTLVSQDYTGTVSRTLWVDLSVGQIKPDDDEKELSAILNALSKLDVSKVIFSDYDQSDYTGRIIWQLKSRAAITPYLKVSDAPPQKAYSDLNILSEGAFSNVCSNTSVKSYFDFYKTAEVKCMTSDSAITDLRHLSRCEDLISLNQEIKKARVSGKSDFILPSSVLVCKNVPPDLLFELRKQ